MGGSRYSNVEEYGDVVRNNENYIPGSSQPHRSITTPTSQYSDNKHLQGSYRRHHHRSKEITNTRTTANRKAKPEVQKVEIQHRLSSQSRRVSEKSQNKSPCSKAPMFPQPPQPPTKTKPPEKRSRHGNNGKVHKRHSRYYDGSPIVDDKSHKHLGYQPQSEYELKTLDNSSSTEATAHGCSINTDVVRSTDEIAGHSNGFTNIDHAPMISPHSSQPVKRLTSVSSVPKKNYPLTSPMKHLDPVERRQFIYRVLTSQSDIFGKQDNTPPEVVPPHLQESPFPAMSQIVNSYNGRPIVDQSKPRTVAQSLSMSYESNTQTLSDSNAAQRTTIHNIPQRHRSVISPGIRMSNVTMSELVPFISASIPSSRSIQPLPRSPHPPTPGLYLPNSPQRLHRTLQSGGCTDDKQNINYSNVNRMTSSGTKGLVSRQIQDQPHLRWEESVDSLSGVTSLPCRGQKTSGHDSQIPSYNTNGVSETNIRYIPNEFKDKNQTINQFHQGSLQLCDGTVDALKPGQPGSSYPMLVSSEENTITTFRSRQSSIPSQYKPNINTHQNVVQQSRSEILQGSVLSATVQTSTVPATMYQLQLDRQESSQGQETNIRKSLSNGYTTTSKHQANTSQMNTSQMNTSQMNTSQMNTSQMNTSQMNTSQEMRLSQPSRKSKRTSTLTAVLEQDSSMEREWVKDEAHRHHKSDHNEIHPSPLCPLSNNTDTGKSGYSEGEGRKVSASKQKAISYSSDVLTKPTHSRRPSVSRSSSEDKEDDETSLNTIRNLKALVNIQQVKINMLNTERLELKIQVTDLTKSLEVLEAGVKRQNEEWIPKLKETIIVLKKRLQTEKIKTKELERTIQQQQEWGRRSRESEVKHSRSSDVEGRRLSANTESSQNQMKLEVEKRSYKPQILQKEHIESKQQEQKTKKRPVIITSSDNTISIDNSSSHSSRNITTPVPPSFSSLRSFLTNGHDETKNYTTDQYSSETRTSSVIKDCPIGSLPSFGSDRASSADDDFHKTHWGNSDSYSSQCQSSVVINDSRGDGNPLLPRF